MTKLAFLLAIALVLMLWAGGRSSQTVTHPLASTTLELGKTMPEVGIPMRTPPATHDLQRAKDAGYRWVCLKLPAEIQKNWTKPLSRKSQASLEHFEDDAHSAKDIGLRVVVDMHVPGAVISQGGRQSSLWNAHLGELARRLRGKVDVWRLNIPGNLHPSLESIQTSKQTIKSADPSASVLLAIEGKANQVESSLHPGITQHLDAVGLVMNGVSLRSSELTASVRVIRAQDSHIPVWIFQTESRADKTSQKVKAFCLLAYNGVSAAFMDIPPDTADNKGDEASLFHLLTQEPNYQGLAPSPKGDHLHLFKSGSKTVAIAWTDNAPRNIELNSPGKLIMEQPDGIKSEFSGGESIQFTLGPEPVILVGPGGWTPGGLQ